MIGGMRIFVVFGEAGNGLSFRKAVIASSERQAAEAALRSDPFHGLIPWKIRSAIPLRQRRNRK